MAQQHAVGSLLGSAVGDALGLPYEGLSPSRARRLFGSPDRQRFFFNYGMVSDDTEHACMVAQSLIGSGADVDSFRLELARRLRYWLLCLPAATGLATLRSILRLWVGFAPEKSGVYSAGNGPGMRSAVIGAVVDDPSKLQQLVRASTRITHSDPKAEYGAFAIALAARMARESVAVTGHDYLDQLGLMLGAEAGEFLTLVEDAVGSNEAGQSTIAFAESMGLGNGVSGYVYHTVPVVIHAWLGNQGDYRAAVGNVIACGGDTDSTAAMVGGIVGTAVGRDGIPVEWLNRLLEWPRTIEWMEQLGVQLNRSIQSGIVECPIGLPIYGVLLRNVFFLLLVLGHGFRRMLPPY